MRSAARCLRPPLISSRARRLWPSSFHSSGRSTENGSAHAGIALRCPAKGIPERPQWAVDCQAEEVSLPGPEALA